jgi:carbamoyltransferase
MASSSELLLATAEPMAPSTDLVVGLGGRASHACVSVSTRDRIVGVCEQERVTRVRAAGDGPSGLPQEALDDLLARTGHRRSDVTTYVTAEDAYPVAGMRNVRLNHHFAHACAAFLPSPMDAATIVVCDHEPPYVSVWDGEGSVVKRIEWPWRGTGFSELYSQCADALGFTAQGKEQRLEALARLEPDWRDDRAASLFSLDTDRLEVLPEWRSRVDEWRGRELPHAASRIAAGLQARIGDLLIELLRQVRQKNPDRASLCVGGSLFTNSYFNSRIKQCGEFSDVFVPVNPDNAGLCVGSALWATGRRQAVSPFLGASFDSEEIKATLDNCKLSYQWSSPADSLSAAVDALKKGRLVGWFDGPMEWGPRALGGRSILANPFVPYVLENLNRFLKQRELWRGYALSGLEAAVRHEFDGPDASPFMECDYAPRDRERFRHILPGPNASVRVHTVGDDTASRFGSLLRAFGDTTGLPMLVNTSFNGFREPIVRSPRDAIRVFFGSGIDMLVFGEFILTK